MLTVCVCLDKPDETLESDSKFAPGRNPVMDPDSPANA